MLDAETYGASRVYTEKSLEGAGALKGDKGDKGEKGDRGERGEKGENGITPEITVKENNAERYVLEIKTGKQTFETPNLRTSLPSNRIFRVNGENIIQI